MRSRADLEPAEEKMELFLSDLATTGHVAVSTQNQAINALLFLYGEGLRWESGGGKRRTLNVEHRTLNRKEGGAG
jgi:hypothetical protein